MPTNPDDIYSEPPRPIELTQEEFEWALLILHPDLEESEEAR